MPSTTTQKTRNKRPDSRPNAKRRRLEHKKITEKERLERVAQKEAFARRHNPVTVERVFVEKRKPQDQDTEKRKQGTGLDAISSRVRSLHKVLRQIQALEEKERNGLLVLNEAQQKKVARFDEIISELEELQTIHDDAEDVENNNDDDDLNPEDGLGENVTKANVS
jgi:hypothetical protein